MKVILHIGGSKCGSSAIQAYLRQNAGPLGTTGVAVPGEKLDFVSTVRGEQIWCFEEMAAAPDCLSARMQALVEAAEAQGCHSVVISAENICNHPALAAPMAHALDGHQVQVPFYVRRQDDFLISGWQQWFLKKYDSVQTYLDDRVGNMACWHRIILPWAEALGDDCIHVRPFVRDALKNRDVVDDFCAVTGLDQTGLSRLSRPANPSFDEALARLAHRVRDVFEDQHDNRFYETMVTLLGEDALKRGSGSSLLSLETRLDILARYEEENEALRTRFLPGMAEGPLFRPPTASDVIERSESEMLSEDMAMMMRCIHALARRATAA